jgi:hypothetical protein
LPAWALRTPGTGDTAQTVIANLQASGTRVTVNKIGEAPLDRCKVISVTPGSPITSQVSGGGGDITWQSQPVIYLTADCTTHGSPKGG